MEQKMQNVVSNMLNEIEGQFACDNGFEIIICHIGI
jgi:hypothetical protein